MIGTIIAKRKTCLAYFVQIIAKKGGIKLMGKNQHVVPVDDQWGIKGEGNGKYTALYDTQEEAIARAREISRNQGSELLIHGKDGRIRERDSYGHDPYPPKG